MDINKLRMISARVREERRGQMIRDVENDVEKSDPAGIAARLMSALEQAALDAAMDGRNEAEVSEIIYKIVRPSTQYGFGNEEIFGSLSDILDFQAYQDMERVGCFADALLAAIREHINMPHAHADINAWSAEWTVSLSIYW
jgi:hypothetical protein